MSLNLWSMVLFASQIIFYLAMLFLTTTGPRVYKVVLLVVSWILWMITTLWYGISTYQIGFILMFIFQFVVIIGSVIFSAERYINENR